MMNFLVTASEAGSRRRLLEGCPGLKVNQG